MGDSSSHKFEAGWIFFDEMGYELKDNSLKTYGNNKRSTAED
jgi:hypothetical protein